MLDGIFLGSVVGGAQTREALSIPSPARSACTQILGSSVAGGAAEAEVLELPGVAAPA